MHIEKHLKDLTDISLELNVEPNPEIDSLLKKYQYIKEIDTSIKWEFSEKQCISEIKTMTLMNHDEAKTLLKKILTKEYKINYPAYQVIQSKKHPALWRVIVNLDLLSIDNL